MPTHKRLLPEISSAVQYQALDTSGARLLPALRVICDRHGLASAPLARFETGTNAVFAAGERHVVKLYPPPWAALAQADRVVAEHIHSRISVATPEVHAHGILEGWSYVVMSRLQGRYLTEVWKTLARPDQVRIAAELGVIVGELHALPTNGLDALDHDWDGFVRSRMQGCVERHRQQEVAEHWLQQIPTFLQRAVPLYPPNFRPTIISGDIHDYHLLAAEEAGRWRLTGLFDFDDARIGFHEYDLAATGLFMLHSRPDLLRAFLLAYGYADNSLDDALSARLLVYTLLHRYRPFNWWRTELVGDTDTGTLEDLGRKVYAL